MWPQVEDVGDTGFDFLFGSLVHVAVAEFFIVFIVLIDVRKFSFELSILLFFRYFYWANLGPVGLIKMSSETELKIISKRFKKFNFSLNSFFNFFFYLFQNNVDTDQLKIKKKESKNTKQRF